MDILYILVFSGLSNPKNGGQNRALNITNQINKYNKVFVLEPENFRDDYDDKIAKMYTYNDLKFSNRKFPLLKDINLNFIQNIRKIIEENNVDIIQISHPSGIIAIRIASFLARKKIPIILNSENVESNFTRDLFSNNKDYSRIERFLIPIYVSFVEKLAIKYLIDVITAVSNDDKNVFIEKYKIKNEKISLIPSGCNLNPIDPSEKAKIKKKMGINLESTTIVFHGSFSHPPNKEAFNIIKERIAPELNKINKNALLFVGGSGLPTFEDKNIISLGFIENLSEFLIIADIAIVPLRIGGGTKLKILDYLSVGLPIVTTKKGIEGIDAINGKDAIILDDVNYEFINAINYLIRNKIERDKIGYNAYKLAKEKYDWNKIGKQLNDLYQAIYK